MSINKAKSIHNTVGRYYIGLMSGTSADGIDLALVEFFDETPPRLIASYYQAYSSRMSEKIQALYQPGNNEIDRAFHLDVELAQQFYLAISALLQQENLTKNDIIAVGNHGQTIRHRPTGDKAFTLQIGCCQTLATLTGIRVIGQFRRKDMALGGQGAPLVPIFHQQLFKQDNNATFVVNIGGIANITFLPEQDTAKQVLGFDTGPGNALLDDWFILHHEESKGSFDKAGSWAASGKVIHALLQHFMQDDYIQLSAPKSTGREYFTLAWLEKKLTEFIDGTESQTKLEPVDVQATLLAFTSQSIVNAISVIAAKGQVYFCGGGIHNVALMKLLARDIGSHYVIDNMESLNIDSDTLEAMAFSWLAFAYDNNLISNMPSVTGAGSGCTLGVGYTP